MKLWRHLNSCPKCDSTRVIPNGDSDTDEYGQHTEYYSCRDCDYAWTETYLLTTAVEDDGPGVDMTEDGYKLMMFDQFLNAARISRTQLPTALATLLKEAEETLPQ